MDWAFKASNGVPGADSARTAEATAVSRSMVMMGWIVLAAAAVMAREPLYLREIFSASDNTKATAVLAREMARISLACRTWPFISIEKVFHVILMRAMSR